MRLVTLFLGGVLAVGALWQDLAQSAGATESPYLYGIHDQTPDPTEFLTHVTNATGAGGWITATVAVGANPAETGGADFSALAKAGHTLICRINYGYYPDGTIPVPSRYDAFAARCKNFVASSSGCSIWLIGNELNLAAEWPFDGARFNYVSPQDYANCFRKVYDAIKSVRPNDKILPQASAPWAGPYGAGQQYVNGANYPADGQPLTWVQYEQQMLAAITNSGPLDGIALHVGSRGYHYSDIHSTSTFGSVGLYSSFYVYKDWVDYGIPPALYSLPIYITECNGLYYWKGGGPPGEDPNQHYEGGWMQEVYAEINRYNQSAGTLGKPIIRCVNLYRWCGSCDGWNIDGASNPYKSQILSDLDSAAGQRYRWPAYVAPTNPPAAPGGLTASVGNALVTLTWNPTPFAASYNIKRGTVSGGPYSVIASNVTTTSYLNTSFTPGTRYYYCVCAVNAFGESPNSAQVTAQPTNGLPDVVITAVSWTPSGSLLAGTSLVFRATVKNQGSASTPTGVTLGVGFSVNEGGNYTWAGSFSSALPPGGGAVTLTADGGSSGNKWLATSGPHTVTATVDDINRFAESREDNNSLSTNFTVFSRNYAVNAGGDATGAFAADNYFAGGYAYSVTNPISTSGVLNPAPQAVYQSERWNNFTYSFPNLVPGANYTVRLHFAEIFYDAAGMRHFHVGINGSQVLTNLDVFAEAGGSFRALAKEFTAMADATGMINIGFSQGAADWPKCSGLEVNFAAWPVNTPPRLAPIAEQFVNAGCVLNLVATATDTNIPAQSLTYSLVTAPTGASINPTNGAFSWTAPATASPLTNLVTVRVLDSGSPALSDSQSFGVVVVPPPQFGSLSATNDSVTLQWRAFPGKRYRVQYLEALGQSVWQDLGSDTLATTNTLILPETAGTNRQRFYRVRQVD